MSFSSKFTKLLTNKYFLYFMVFLAATNILGYLVTNTFNAIVFFILVALITYQFSKNMAIILLVSIIFTNLLMSNKRIREGLENQPSSNVEKAAAIDPQIASAIPAVQSSTTNDEVKEKMKNTTPNTTVPETTTNMDINNMDLNKQVQEAGAPEGFGEKISNNKKDKNDKQFAPRLDYAATIEQSYQNLDELLGTDSIQKLSQDTQKLMSQQQNLFNTMNQMVPVLEGAQNMLKNFDIGDLSKSLKGLSALGITPNK